VTNPPVAPPRRLNALTGLRCFAALNIVFFHFSNPQWFGPLAPVVNSGYISVSFFILLSGYVLAYNYAERGQRGEIDSIRFWKARLARLYPIYILSLILGLSMVPVEWGAHTHFMFWLGVVLTPLLLQGWIPALATFINTPAWTISAEAFYYALFPWIARWRRPRSLPILLGILTLLWLLATSAGFLYTVFSPDGIANPDRYTGGIWMRALKYTPLPHLSTFLFGVVLAAIDDVLPRTAHWRAWVGLGGFAALYFVLAHADHLPYALLHDGLLLPLFAPIVLGLAGENWLSHVLGFRGFVMIGEASYCMYLLHFNMWTMLHKSGLLVMTGLIRFDPWISYVILVLLALAALHWIEKPAQRWMKKLLKA
jgi:peptidoglycan/LPS O-acetylase OafA/YrhL